MDKELELPPGLRIRRGKLHYRFVHAGEEWTGSTGLVATKRNVSAALDALAKSKEEVRSGRGHLLSLHSKTFSEAAEEFLKWADGEHREHPSTARRLRTSFASLKTFFGKTFVHSITANRIEQYKTWRRLENKVEEVTIRHDLHALSPFFKYAVNANWCRDNPVKQVDVPSGEDSVRDHVVTPEEERAYFSTALSKFEMEKDGKKKKHGPFPALHDVAKLILLQGMRPEEVMSLQVEHIDLDKKTLRIIKGKSKAAKRTLNLWPESVLILAARIGKRKTGWVFQGKREGTHLTKLNNSHDAVIEKIQASFVLYEFRHTFATRFGEAVGDPIALAAILGHSPSNLKTVMKYCHPQASHTSKAMKTFMEASQKQAEIAASVVN